MSLLHRKDFHAVPSEAQFIPKPHNKGLMGNKLTVKLYPTTVAAGNEYKPGQGSLKFSIKNSKSIDPRSLRLHFGLQVDETIAKGKNLKAGILNNGTSDAINNFSTINSTWIPSSTLSKFGGAANIDGNPVFDDWAGSWIKTLDVKFAGSQQIERIEPYNKLRGALAKVTVDDGYKTGLGQHEGYHQIRCDKVTEGLNSSDRVGGKAYPEAPNHAHLWHNSAAAHHMLETDCEDSKHLVNYTSGSSYAGWNKWKAVGPAKSYQTDGTATDVKAGEYMMLDIVPYIDTTDACAVNDSNMVTLSGGTDAEKMITNYSSTATLRQRYRYRQLSSRAEAMKEVTSRTAGVLSDDIEGKKFRTKRAMCIPLDLSGVLNMEKFLFIPSIVSLDLEFTLEDAQKCCAGMLSSSTGADDSSLAYRIIDPYLTVDTYDFSSEYLSALSQTLSGPGISLDFDTYRIYRPSVTITGGNLHVLMQRRFASLKSLYVMFDLTPLNRGHNLLDYVYEDSSGTITAMDSDDAETKTVWGDTTTATGTASTSAISPPCRNIQVRKARAAASMLPGPCETVDVSLLHETKVATFKNGTARKLGYDTSRQFADFKNKTSYHANPFVDNYMVLADNVPVTTHRISTKYDDCSEAIHELAKSLRMHGELSLESRLTPSKFTNDTFIIGCDFENANMISGLSVSEILIQLELSSDIPSGWKGESINCYVVAHYDKRVIIQSGGRFTEIE
jgi:hypothetical protein